MGDADGRVSLHPPAVGERSEAVGQHVGLLERHQLHIPGTPPNYI